MRDIGKTKISALHSKHNTTYPQIRLPQQYFDVIGKTAHIFETQYNTDKTFLIIVGNENSTEPFVIKTEQKVLKLLS
jgi:hypothetical protein